MKTFLWNKWRNIFDLAQGTFISKIWKHRNDDYFYCKYSVDCFQKLRWSFLPGFMAHYLGTPVLMIIFSKHVQIHEYISTKLTQLWIKNKNINSCQQKSQEVQTTKTSSEGQQTSFSHLDFQLMRQETILPFIRTYFIWFL